MKAICNKNILCLCHIEAITLFCGADWQHKNYIPQMPLTKSHKIKLYPNKHQEQFFRQSCGVARFAYNWSLSRWKEMHEHSEKPSAYTLIKEITSIKRTEFPWMLEVGKCAPQYAIHNLEDAWKKYFKQLESGVIESGRKSYIKSKQSKGLEIKEQKLNDFGKPNFKKKGIKDSFVAIENKEYFGQKDFKIRIPRLGWVKCAENLRFEGKVNNVTIKRIADMWFAVVNVEVLPKEAPLTSENQAVIGVDLGIKHLAVTSNGDYFENPNALKQNLQKLRREQKSLCRKQKGSSNRKKQQMKVARLHYRISSIRGNALHQITSFLVRNADIIVLEDLNISGMVRNHKLARAIQDVSFYEFRRQIEYKAAWAGKQVIFADRFYPSSKTCSNCGHLHTNLKLSDRIYDCVSCGLSIDRDLNAAKNLAGLGSTVKFTGSQACGVGSSAVKSVQPDSEAGINIINNLN